MTWGKYEEQMGRIIMPFSVSVHHAFVDGLHVGMLIKNIQKSLNAYLD